MGKGSVLPKTPIGFAGEDVDLYGYVSNNPMNYVDPLGLRYFDINVNINLLYGFGVTFGAMIGRQGPYPCFGEGLV